MARTTNLRSTLNKSVAVYFIRNSLICKKKKNYNININNKNNDSNNNGHILELNSGKNYEDNHIEPGQGVIF